MKKSLILSILFACFMALCFVSCETSPANGCKCTIEYDGEKLSTQKITLKQMKKEYDVKTCAALEKAALEEIEEAIDDEELDADIDDFEISCKGY